MNWWDQAACRGESPDIFFLGPAKAHRGPKMDYAEARAICAACPVRTVCLDDAIAVETTGRRYGMFGGMSPDERTVEFRRRDAEGRVERRAAKFAQCGTAAGYHRHKTYLHEPACAACKHAHAASKAFSCGRDAYTTTSPPVDQLHDLTTIASRRELYEGDDDLEESEDAS